MLFITVIYIPLHLRKVEQNNSSIQAGEAFSDKKIPDMRKLLLVFILVFIFFVLIIVLHFNKELEKEKNIFPLYIFTMLPILILSLYAVDKDVYKVSLKCLRNSYLWQKITVGSSARITPVSEA
jgi:uncharacterized membrane protein YadS